MGVEKLIHDALSNCVVSNGTLSFDRRFSAEELKIIHKKFTEDLYNFKVPHYRVVGIFHEWDIKSDKSMLITNGLYNTSMLEIEQRARHIIPMEIGGNDPAKGCFIMAGEEIENYQPNFSEWIGIPANKGKRAEYLTVPHNEVGTLFLRKYMPQENVPDNQLCLTSNMYYMEYFVEGSIPTKARVLVNDYPILKFGESDIYGLERIGFIYKRGTGVVDYSETRQLFAEKADRIMPVRTVYDLVTYVVVGNRYEDGVFTLKYPFAETMDEEVLTTIFNEYGKEFAE